MSKQQGLQRSPLQRSDVQFPPVPGGGGASSSQQCLMSFSPSPFPHLAGTVARAVDRTVAGAVTGTKRNALVQIPEVSPRSKVPKLEEPEDVNKRLRSAEASLHTLRSELESKKEAVHDAVANMQEAQRQLSEAQGRLNDVEKERRTAVANMEAAQRELEAEREEAQNRLNVVEQERRTAVANMEAAQRELKDRGSESLVESAKQLAKLGGKVELYDNLVKDQRDQIIELTNRGAEMWVELQAFRAEKRAADEKAARRRASAPRPIARGRASAPRPIARGRGAAGPRAGAGLSGGSPASGEGEEGKEGVTGTEGGPDGEEVQDEGGGAVDSVHPDADENDRPDADGTGEPAAGQPETLDHPVVDDTGV